MSFGKFVFLKRIGLFHLCYQIYIYNFFMKWKCSWLSRVWLFATPWAIVCQAPLSMEFSRQEYWSGQPSPSPGDLPNPGIEPGSPALQADPLRSEPPGKPQLVHNIPLLPFLMSLGSVFFIPDIGSYVFFFFSLLWLEIYFLLLALGLICSSSSYFLRQQFRLLIQNPF